VGERNKTENKVTKNQETARTVSFSEGRQSNNLSPSQSFCCMQRYTDIVKYCVRKVT